MEPRYHSIGKLVFDLHFDTQADADKLQQSFPQTFEKRVKSALAEAFSQVLTNGETIVIERIELDLGNVTPDDLADGLRNALVQSLTKQLKISLKTSDGREVIKIPTEELWTEIFVFFLNSGHFPWWAVPVTIGELEAAILKETETLNPVVFDKIMAALIQENTRQRLIIQFSPKFNLQLISNLFPTQSGFILNTIAVVRNVLVQNNIAVKETGNEWTELVWQLLLQHDQRTGFQRIFPAQLFSLICKKYGLDKQVIIRKVAEPLRSVLAKSGKKNKVPHPATNEKLKNEAKNKKHELKELFISNCGLVIFWPFLKPLFENLNLLSGDNFISDQHRERALLMLQYLVTGFPTGEEQNLQLNKILTGWVTTKPLQKSIRLKKAEKAELDEFLAEIIKNWTALKNSSVTALRETFLQRNGILRAANKSFSLKIERKGVDILRDNLPWTISVIKLPWMNEILYVEW